LAKWDVEQHVHSAGQIGWPDRIHGVFKRYAIRQVGYVPDTGHARLIELCIKDNEIKDVVLASETEGPGLVLGAALGGCLVRRHCSAEQRRRQLHQYVLNPEELRHPLCCW
jgi:hypothetical protein